MSSKTDGKTTNDERIGKHQQHLRRQRDAVAYRMKKLAAKQVEITKKTNDVKEKLQKKYEDMRRVLDEDLRIALTQLDAERRAMEKLVEDKMEDCYQLTQDLDQELSNLTAEVNSDRRERHVQNPGMKKRISETLRLTDPDLIHMDDFKNEQLLSLAVNLLVFIRSQVPVAKKLLQSYAADVVLDPDTAHPKLVISPEGDSASYTDTWQDVPETPSRFDNTLNVLSRRSLSEGRHYWEVEVGGKTYWELGLTYPGIPRKGGEGEEACWLGRGPESWCVEYFNGDYNAWHGGVQHELPLVAERKFSRIGVFCSFPGGLVCFLGADTMTPIHCFCAGTFAGAVHQALCPGHDNDGTNWTPLRICDASRSAPVL
ncbi:E3 ubiquitin-protein ligase TRIM39 [Salarias fasciatus]|uniref:E3 ubiquitin-protein ligase TRIM39 n=1 Tax=Salarias fasciatus TaxID=181472 RepID=UPI001176AD1E|nr:E3 ubiquitin-protein ligase TRIM39-like [Salarias fasciatus]